MLHFNVLFDIEIADEIFYIFFLLSLKVNVYLTFTAHLNLDMPHFDECDFCPKEFFYVCKIQEVIC